MSSRYRLVALVGLVLLGAAVYAIFALMRDDTPAPDAAVEAYLDDWSDGDFAAMEERVVDAPSSFVDDYQAVADDLGVTEAAYELTSVDVGGSAGVARYSAAVQLEGVDGEWTWDGTLSIAEDGGDWLIEWAPANIHPDLSEGQHLARAREVPERAPILDASGNPLSTGRPARVIGLEPRAVLDLNLVKAAFQQQLGIDPAVIDERLNAPGVQPDHFVEITTVDNVRYDQVAPVIYPLPGTRFRDTFLRGGPTPEYAAHIIGSYGEITAERLDELGAPYQAGDLVGLSGLEGRFEEQLAGTPSTTVQVVDEDGTVVADVHRFEGRPPEPVQTTIDTTVQSAVEAALGSTTAPTAIVVVDSQSNIRAVASRPLGEYNRALAGEYAPGSTFKIVTTSAPARPRRHARHARRLRPDDQRRRPVVPQLRAVEPRHGPVRAGVRPVVQHGLHLGRRRRARPRVRGRGRVVRLQLRVLGRPRHRHRQLPHAGRRHRARGRRHRAGTGDRQPAAHGHGGGHRDRRHVGAAGAAAERPGAERPRADVARRGHEPDAVGADAPGRDRGQRHGRRRAGRRHRRQDRHRRVRLGQPPAHPGLVRRHPRRPGRRRARRGRRVGRRGRGARRRPGAGRASLNAAAQAGPGGRRTCGEPRDVRDGGAVRPTAGARPGRRPASARSTGRHPRR